MNARWTPGEWFLGETQTDYQEYGYDGCIYAPPTPEEEQQMAEQGYGAVDLDPVARVDHKPDALLIVQSKNMAQALEDCLALLSTRFGSSCDPEAEELMDRLVLILHRSGAGEPLCIPGEKPPLKPSGLCENPRCNGRPATDLAYSRRLNRVFRCCHDHAESISDEDNPQYIDSCANCGCLNPIN